MQVNDINSYLTSVEGLSALTHSSAAASTTTTSTSSSDTDSYVSTITDSEAVLPCENYNDILTKIQSAANTSNDNTATDTGDSASSSVSGGGSSGGSSDSTSTTVTIVTMGDGSKYVKTVTTDSEGKETVTMSKISDGDSPTQPEDVNPGDGNVSAASTAFSQI